MRHARALDAVRADAYGAPSSFGAGDPGAEAYPSGRSRIGVIRIAQIRPLENFSIVGRKNPARAARYLAGYPPTIRLRSDSSETISALPTNAGPSAFPIHTIAGLPRRIRLAFQLAGEVSISTWLPELTTNHTGAGLLLLPSLRTVAM